MFWLYRELLGLVNAGCAKAPRIDDRKWGCIGLILDYLRSSILGSFRRSRNTSNLTVRGICFIAGFLLVAFGQPAWIPGFGMLASAGGYALFWTAMLQLAKPGRRFLLALLWYSSVQAVQLSWMTSTEYMGPMILGVYALLLLGLGLQFGLLSCWLKPKQPLTWLSCAGLAGGWVLLEWIRVFFLTGFTWNPAGLALADHRLSIQLASVAGVYGLSFWVIWTNLAGVRALSSARTKKSVLLWFCSALFPYAFGLGHQMWVERRLPLQGQERLLQAALIDTDLRIEEKNFDRSSPDSFVFPLDQWERVWSALGERQLDLIVLPEAAFPYGALRPLCYLEDLQERWEAHFGPEASFDFPPLQPPFAFSYRKEGSEKWLASNAWIAQSLSNHYGAEVIVGLDVDDRGRRYNAAFQFHPWGGEPERYEKRILAPVGEYIPLQNVRWISEFLAKEFAIESSFDAGTQAKIFSAPVPVGSVICLEEVYSGAVRELRKKGAELFVSLSNDAWFPGSRLARQHFDHGRVRAVENGVFLLRSSNMGITGMVDCFGQLSAPIEEASGECRAKMFSMPVFSYPTLYAFWGDEAILFASGALLLCFLARSIYRRKSCP